MRLWCFRPRLRSAFPRFRIFPPAGFWPQFHPRPSHFYLVLQWLFHIAGENAFHFYDITSERAHCQQTKRKHQWPLPRMGHGSASLKRFALIELISQNNQSKWKKWNLFDFCAFYFLFPSMFSHGDSI